MIHLAVSNEQLRNFLYYISSLRGMKWRSNLYIYFSKSVFPESDCLATSRNDALRRDIYTLSAFYSIDKIENFRLNFKIWNNFAEFEKWKIFLNFEKMKKYDVFFKNEFFSGFLIFCVLMRKIKKPLFSGCFSCGLYRTRTCNLALKRRLLYHWANSPFDYIIYDSSFFWGVSIPLQDEIIQIEE